MPYGYNHAFSQYPNGKDHAPGARFSSYPHTSQHKRAREEDALADGHHQLNHLSISPPPKKSTPFIDLTEDSDDDFDGKDITALSFAQLNRFKHSASTAKSSQSSSDTAVEVAAPSPIPIKATPQTVKNTSSRSIEGAICSNTLPKDSALRRAEEQPQHASTIAYSTYDTTQNIPIFKRGRGRPAKDAPKPEPREKRPRGRPPLNKPKEKIPQLEVKKSRDSSTPIEDEWRQARRVDLDASHAYMKDHECEPFIQRLKQVPGPEVTVINEIDNELPPRDFFFVNEYQFRKGTGRIDPAARTGCSCPSDARNVGCEYLKCECLEDCARDENGKPLGFPYRAAGDRRGCLRPLYLKRRDVIYECNELCNCPSNCKNKVVQKGRKVPLEIFKTRDRGWGLRCPVDLREGQFVEVYLGEVVNDAEAKRREAASEIKKNSYLFALDKFFEEGTFVVDGQMFGSPARFFNHCCDPNLCIYAVSLVRGDPYVYELAFFANMNIPAGTELTFDYMDRDQDEEKFKSRDNVEDGMVRCRCGAPNCRRWLWI